MTRPVLQQHLESAAILWLRRDRAVSEPHYRLDNLARLDDQLEANLDGLRISGDAAWEMCEEELHQWQEPGEVFTAAVLAFESSIAERIYAVLDVARQDDERLRPFISALGWLDYERAKRWIDLFNADEGAVVRRVGIAAAAVHRVDPGNALRKALEHSVSLLCARAARAAGELGRSDLLPVLRERMMAGDRSCAAAAAWSVGRFAGDAEAIELLRSIVEENGAQSNYLLHVAMRRMDVVEAKQWIHKLSRQSDSIRSAVMGAGILGDPELIPWLIDMMAETAVARLAGESFSMITGVDIAYRDLERKAPANFCPGPNDDPDDENVAMDPDENLPWPDLERIREWWHEHCDQFSTGKTYLVGKPLTVNWMNEVLRHGYQRQRAVAAMELAILEPNGPLFEIRARGIRQQQLLGLK